MGKKSDDGPEVEKIDFEVWLRPTQAVKLLAGRGSWGTYTDQIVTRLKNDLIDAAADHATIRTGGKIEPMTLLRVPSTLWSGSVGSPSHSFWRTGDVEFMLPSTGYSVSSDTVALFDVRFRPEQIRAMVVPEDHPAIAPAPAATPRRGAKRKDWWDHLWIEMIRRIRAGTLNPSKTSDLQRILEEYVGNELAQDFGDSTLKPMATNLFKYLEEIRGK